MFKCLNANVALQTTKTKKKNNKNVAEIQTKLFWRWKNKISLTFLPITEEDVGKAGKSERIFKIIKRLKNIYYTGNIASNPDPYS